MALGAGRGGVSADGGHGHAGLGQQQRVKRPRRNAKKLQT